MTTKIVVFPAQTLEQAKDMARKILEKQLGDVVRIYKDVYQTWLEDGKVGEDNIVTLRVRTTEDRVEELHKFVKSIHPWPVFCFEVLSSEYKDFE